MKKMSLSVVLILVVTLAYSQSMKEEVEIFQNVFGIDKKAAVAEFIQLEDNSFWELYDAYEVERKDLGKKRIELINNYAQNYNNMTDEKIEQILKQSAKVTIGLDKLVLKYYKKMKKAVGIKKAAQFAQIENYFLAAIRYELSSQIPFIDELN